jgi:hypothetical protein
MQNKMAMCKKRMFYNFYRRIFIQGNDKTKSVDNGHGCYNKKSSFLQSSCPIFKYSERQKYGINQGNKFIKN